jgi:hypothetical protein
MGEPILAPVARASPLGSSAFKGKTMITPQDLDVTKPTGEPLKLTLQRTMWFLDGKSSVRRFSCVTPDDEGYSTGRYLRYEADARGEGYGVIRDGKVYPLLPESGAAITVTVTGDNEKDSHVSWVNGVNLVVGLGHERFEWLWNEIIDRPTARLNLITVAEAYSEADSWTERSYIPDEGALPAPGRFNITLADPPEPPAESAPASPSDKRLKTVINLLWAILGVLIVIALNV